MRAELLSIGTELLLGQITDTNSAYLAARLAGLGIDLMKKHWVLLIYQAKNQLLFTCPN